MPLPSLKEVIHSLFQDKNLVQDLESFNQILDDAWDQTWIKNEKIYRVGGDSDNLNTPIYSEDELIAAESVIEKSIDTLAFYVSYHYSRNSWGIYLLRSGVLAIAKYLVDKGIRYWDAVEIARRFLVRHELTHFQTDFGITSLELAIKKSLYIPYRRDIRATSPGWNLAEEGLANRLGRSEIGSHGKLMNDFLNTSPVGYRDWNDHKARDEANCWSSILNLKTLLGPSSESTLMGLNSMFVAKKYFGDVPIYEVIDLPGVRAADYFLGAITNIRETKEFREDLDKLAKGQPSYRKKWDKTKQKLQQGNLIGGTHLEKLKGTKYPIYSIGLDSEARVALRREVTWEALAADHHDNLYSRMNRKFGA